MINNGGTLKFFNVKVRAYHDQVIAGEAIPIQTPIPLISVRSYELHRNIGGIVNNRKERSRGKWTDSFRGKISILLKSRIKNAHIISPAWGNC
jgi:hypothetical protein